MNLCPNGKVKRTVKFEPNKIEQVYYNIINQNLIRKN